MIRRKRLDSELLRRGITANLEEAERLIAANKVQVNGSFATTAAQMVLKGDSLNISPDRTQYVSRGGHKLAHALSAFSINPDALDCVDVGASTGGFTDCLLQEGASTVTTIDVGYGVLHECLVNDARVTKFERLNIRDANPIISPKQFRLLVADLSFISLKTVLQNLVDLCDSGASMVLLVKPQFESSYEEASRSGGVIRDPDIWERTLEEVAEEASKVGAPLQAVTYSPLTGPRGNHEFFFHLVKGAKRQAVDVSSVIEDMKPSVQ